MPEIKTYKYHKMSKIATLIGKCCGSEKKSQQKQREQNHCQTQQTYMTVQTIKSLSKILQSYLVKIGVCSP